MRFLRCLRDFKKWSWIGKMRKNGVKSLSQNPHLYTTNMIIIIVVIIIIIIIIIIKDALFRKRSCLFHCDTMIKGQLYLYVLMIRTGYPWIFGSGDINQPTFFFTQSRNKILFQDNINLV